MLETFYEPLEKPYPDLVLADLVLDAVIEIWIVVDLHHDESSVGFFDVYPIQTLADWTSSPNCSVEEIGGSLVEADGAPTALPQRAIGAVLDDLPMTARHTILTHEQRLAAHHPHAPVERGWQEFLRQQEIRVLEQLVSDPAKFLGSVRFVNAAGERAVGNFHDQRRESSSIARVRSPTSAISTVGGIATRFLLNNAMRKTLWVHRIMEIG